MSDYFAADYITKYVGKIYEISENEMFCKRMCDSQSWDYFDERQLVILVELNESMLSPDLNYVKILTKDGIFYTWEDMIKGR